MPTVRHRVPRMIEGRYADRFRKPKPEERTLAAGKRALKQIHQDETGCYALVHWPGEEPIWRYRHVDYRTVEAHGTTFSNIESFKKHVMQVRERDT